MQLSSILVVAAGLIRILDIRGGIRISCIVYVQLIYAPDEILLVQHFQVVL